MYLTINNTLSQLQNADIGTRTFSTISTYAHNAHTFKYLGKTAF